MSDDELVLRGHCNLPPLSGAGSAGVCTLTQSLPWEATRCLPVPPSMNMARAAVWVCAAAPSLHQRMRVAWQQ